MTARPFARARRARGGLAAVAALTAVVLAACGGSGDDEPSGGSSGPDGTTLKLSFLEDPGQPPDPDIYYAGQGLLLTTNLYEGLLAYQPGQAEPEIVPALATEWEASDDNTTFTLTLREGVTFHDGTDFTADAVKASFDRRLAVGQGPSYMVADVKDVVADGDYKVTITLNNPDAAFLDYLAAPYGPKMMSPTGLAENAGDDDAQTYLQTNDLGTGPYTLTAAEVGSRYQMKAFPEYWGAEPYFTDIEIPVLADTSTQQLQFDSGDLDAILHDLPASAVTEYLADDSVPSYTLPTFMSDFLYVNPNTPAMADPETRRAVLQAVDVQAVVDQVYAGRGEVADQLFPPGMLDPAYGKQDVEYDPEVLTSLAASLPADQKAITIGHDSNSPDNQLAANLLATQLSSAGLTANVQSFTTSQVFGWIGAPQETPDILLALGWPDAAPPYTWGYISYAQGGGLNYFGCGSDELDATLAEALPTNDPEVFDEVAQQAGDLGCWLNLVEVSDFMVAQPWLGGVEEAHVVAAPNTLMLNLLTADGTGNS